MFKGNSTFGIALAALISIPFCAWAQTGGGDNGGGSPIVTPGGRNQADTGPAGLPGGAPGVQRAPLNAEPGANDGAEQPRPAGEDDRAFPQNAPVGADAPAALSDDEIRQACMMKANPDECRTRKRGGVPDESIERNPP